MMGLNAEVLKLGMTHPLPDQMILDFMKRHSQVVVVEELEPFLETQARRIAQLNGLKLEILGKEQGYFARTLEYSSRTVVEALSRIINCNTPIDWTELDIWRYIERENIPVTDLYFDRGEGKRFRSLGCYPCTKPVESTAKNVSEIIEELQTGKFANIAERAGREQDKEDGGGLETLRRGGYM